MTDSKGPTGSISEEFELLERHICILKTVHANQPVGLIRLSDMTGIPKHKVRYSLKLLEKEGIIVATQDGATTSDLYEGFMESTKTYIEGLHDKVERLMKSLMES